LLLFLLGGGGKSAMLRNVLPYILLILTFLYTIFFADKQWERRQVLLKRKLANEEEAMHQDDPCQRNKSITTYTSTSDDETDEFL
jgi:hypothetical protein